MSRQSLSDFVRLALLGKYGGIYLDVSTFSVEGVEWVLNIAQVPVEGVLNRYGELPKALVTHWPVYGMNYN